MGRLDLSYQMIMIIIVITITTTTTTKIMIIIKKGLNSWFYTDLKTFKLSIK